MKVLGNNWMEFAWVAFVLAAFGCMIIAVAVELLIREPRRLRKLGIRRRDQ